MRKSERPEPLIAYADFRTGRTYREIYDEMRSHSEDRSTWRYRGRSGVLGYWRQLKLQMYALVQADYDARLAAWQAGRRPRRARAALPPLSAVPF